MKVPVKNGEEVLKAAESLGLKTQTTCSSLIWTRRNAHLPYEDFMKAIIADATFADPEIFWMLNHFQEVLSQEVTDHLIRVVCKDPDNAVHLVKYALKWPEASQKTFFACFIELFPEDPYTAMSRSMFQGVRV